MGRAADEPAGPMTTTRAGIAPRLATLVVVVVFVSFIAITVAWVEATGATPLRTTVALVAAAAMLFMQLYWFSRPGSVSGRSGLWLLLVNALVAYLPLPVLGYAWTSIPAFVAGNCLLVLRGPLAWAAWAAVVASVGVLEYALGSPAAVLYTVVAIGQTGLIIAALTWLRTLVATLGRVRAQQRAHALAEDRLRFARDLHDLLGTGLSAITLKLELAVRLARRDTERAVAELDDATAIARQAQIAMPTVAGGIQRPVLRAEADHARSVLAATGEATHMVVGTPPADLPRDIDSTLATVLREAVTNVLRHSTPRHCTISFDDAGPGYVEMTVVNDGVGAAAPGGRPGMGLDNLAQRVAAVGGTLEAGREGADRFRFRVRVPTSARPSATAASSTPPDGDPGDVPIRRFRAIVLAVVAGYLVVGVEWIRSTVDGPVSWAAIAAVTAVAALCALHLGDPHRDPRSRAGYGVVALLAVLVLGVLLGLQNPFVGTPGLLVGALLLVAPLLVAVPATLAVIATLVLLHVQSGSPPLLIIYGIVSTTMTGIVVYGMIELLRTASHLHAARSELADLAVTDQRLRFEHDLQELIGADLTVLESRARTVRHALAHDPGGAEDELTDMVMLVRGALAEVRSTAHSYRNASGLAVETESARTMLRSADIDVRVDMSEVRPSRALDGVLAAVVRECAGNVLAHSEATWVEVRLAECADELRLEIVNDGVRRNGKTSDSGGLARLRHGLDEIGGSLQAGPGPTHGTFGLLVRVPVSAAQHR
jgi:signal transduction histidine kinase